MMKSVLIVNLLATAATASMASDFASRQEVGTSVGLRGQRRLPKEKDNKPRKEKDSNTRKEKESDTTNEKPADNKRGRDDTKKGGADIDLDEYEREVAKKMEKEKKQEKQAKHDEKHRVKKEKRDKANAKAKRDKTTSPDDAAVADPDPAPEPAPEPAPAAPVIEVEEVPEPAPALPPIAEEVSITEDAAETTDATDVAAVDTVEIEERGPTEDEDENSDIEEVAPAVDTTTWANDATTATPEDESATAEAIDDTRSKATLLPCPSEYDSDVTYVAGDTIAMNEHIFACRSGPYEEFCSIELFDDDWDEQEVKYWEDAWDLVGKCAAPVVGAEAPAAAEPELAPIELDDEPELAPIVLDDEPEVAVLVSMPTDATTDATTDSTEWATTDAATTDVAIADLATTDATPMDATDATAWGTTDATTADATTDASATSTSSTEELLASTELATTSATEAALEEDDLDLPAPTESPTFMPTVTLPDCPPHYDAARTDYVAGETTEVNEHIFQCRTGGQLYFEDEEGDVLEVIDVSYEKYCNIANWDEALKAESEHAKVLWGDAWTHVGGCLL